MAVLLRFFFAIKGFQNIPIFTVISVIAILTMFVGNFLAIREQEPQTYPCLFIHRESWLPVDHIVDRQQRRGESPAIFYIISYVVTTLGAFGIISLLSQSSHDNDRLESYKGLFWATTLAGGSIFTHPPFLGQESLLHQDSWPNFTLSLQV